MTILFEILSDFLPGMDLVFIDGLCRIDEQHFWSLAQNQLDRVVSGNNIPFIIIGADNINTFKATNVYPVLQLPHAHYLQLPCSVSEIQGTFMKMKEVGNTIKTFKNELNLLHTFIVHRVRMLRHTSENYRMSLYSNANRAKSRLNTGRSVSTIKYIDNAAMQRFKNENNTIFPHINHLELDPQGKITRLVRDADRYIELINKGDLTPKQCCSLAFDCAKAFENISKILTITIKT